MVPEANLTTPDEQYYDKAVPVTAISEWALANFASVEEVKQAVENGYFWSPVLKHFGDLKSPLHYAFYDKKGAVSSLKHWRVSSMFIRKRRKTSFF
ncbi:linear amide C-N hydrolase [uncultured Cedecea sp.]|uniref:linear amide C-N hydrolase n=1 Tax=uncultured Cedecea sp. TaxID=988762 RepID=UPI00263974C3|nr:linear amide C-N hydrolase [uncultured Cedecea sp.]